MAAEYTANYGLCQWAATDKVLRTDFNQDNAKVDAALKSMADRLAALASLESQVQALSALVGRVEALEGKVVSGSYVGSGEHGNFDPPNTLTFDKRPYLVIVTGKTTALFPGTVDEGVSTPPTGDNNASNNFTWTGNTLKWFNYSDVYYQLNQAGQTYHYRALYL